MGDQLSTEEQGKLIAKLRVRRGLTQEILAETLGIDVGTIARWERGAQRIRSRNMSALAAALDVGIDQLLGEHREPDVETSHRDLRIVDLVEWLADTSGRPFAEIYRAVATEADRLENEAPPDRHARNHARSRVGREDLATAVADFYKLPSKGRSLFTAEVGGKELTVSILADRRWARSNIDLLANQELARFVAPNPPLEIPFTTEMLDAGIARLADAEVHDRVLVNNPMYRLLSIDLTPQGLRSEFALATFADYALRNGLMEMEFTDALASSANQRLGSGDETPIRSALLPSVDRATDFGSYFCTGGPVALFAVARPAEAGRPADYALLVQARGRRVMDIAGKLSTIPKGWHQPVGEPAAEVSLSATLLRELEEELLGREDLEQITTGSRRAAAPMHRERHPEALLPLLDDPKSFHLRCAGFGLNLLSGTYEVPCLIVIDDDRWWDQWGHLIEGNWETMSIECVSSMDTEGLVSLIHDQRWSNEGLFALLQGLRCLSEIDRSDRVAAPLIRIVDQQAGAA